MRMRWLIALMLALALAAGSCSDGDDEPPEASELGDREEPEIDIPDDGDPPDRLVIDDLVVGTGAEAVPGSIVTVHYVGAAWSDGEVFDSSWDDGEPIDFQLGVQQVIPGWDRGVDGMQVGGRRRLTIPPDLAYGEYGGGPIGPNETLVFVIDLVSVNVPSR